MEPPDPGDPVPPAACFVTIDTSENDNSSKNMDTDELTTSIVNNQAEIISSKRKRKNLTEDSNKNELNTKTNTSIPRNDNEVNKTSSNFVPVGRSQYRDTDSAPYIVHVVREQNTSNDGSTLHPITFGRFLTKNNVRNVVNGSVKRIGRNRISLSFSNYKDANSFIDNKNLGSEKLKAFIPTFSITRMGLVRGIPTEWSDAEIIENVNVPIGCGKILKIRRLNYKVNVGSSPVWKPSQTVVITFDGKILPKHIYLCYNSIAVELYTFPTILCYNCCHFGHTKTQCRSKTRCYKCGQDHAGDTCAREEDCATCYNCSGSHFATNKSCPELIRQKNIKVTMAENCISYAEAMKMHAPVGKSYADVLSSVKPTLVERPILFRSPSPLSSSGSSRGKIISTKPRSPARLVKGYDRLVHHEIIKDYNIPSGSNGCGYANPSCHDQELISQQSLKEIITTLIETLTQNNILIPSNVAPLIESLKKSSPNLRSESNTFRTSPTGQST